MASSELKNVEKRLAQLKANKEKEEARAQENIDKLTAKYNEDVEKLRANFEVKKAVIQKDLDVKMSDIKPEITRFEGIRKKLEAIEKQMAALRLDISGGVEETPKEEQKSEMEIMDETPVEEQPQYDNYQY